MQRIKLKKIIMLLERHEFDILSVLRQSLKFKIINTMILVFLVHAYVEFEVG